MGHSPWGLRESDTTEQLTHTSLSRIKQKLPIGGTESYSFPFTSNCDQIYTQFYTGFKTRKIRQNNFRIDEEVDETNLYSFIIFPQILESIIIVI